MAWCTQETVFNVVENLVKTIWQRALGMEIKTPFVRMRFDDVMSRYGCDKPDTRYELHLQDLSQDLRHTSFNAFRKVLDDGGSVRAVNLKRLASLSQSATNQLLEVAKNMGKVLLFFFF
jgi:aspartyl-tRNA synthetase